MRLIHTTHLERPYIVQVYLDNGARIFDKFGTGLEENTSVMEFRYLFKQLCSNFWVINFPRGEYNPSIVLLANYNADDELVQGKKLETFQYKTINGPIF